MMHAYDEIYIEGAMIRMGDMFEYAVLDLGYDIDYFFKLLIDSHISSAFEVGNATIISGYSGPELAMMIIEETEHESIYVEPSWREYRSDVYWSGWILAYYQWYVNEPFANIWKYVTMHTLLKLYPTYHEADIHKTVEELMSRKKEEKKYKIVDLRKVRNLSQGQLAIKANMSISQIQRLEYGERKVENLSLKTALSLADALGVSVQEMI